MGSAFSTAAKAWLTAAVALLIGPPVSATHDSDGEDPLRAFQWSLDQIHADNVGPALNRERNLTMAAGKTPFDVEGVT